MHTWLVAGLAPALALCGCRPTATVQRTTPVANLQPYRGVLVRGNETAGEGHLALLLERAASVRIRDRCGFLDVTTTDRPAPQPPDLILDFTVQRAFRGGQGLVKNQNLATVDVTVVLSDGLDEELIGSADIQGKSSGIEIGGITPEEEAIDAVADTVASLLVSSGCTGPRIARTQSAPPPDPEPSPPDGSDPSDDPGSDPSADPPGGEGDAVAEAEAENEEGKRLFRAADVAGAKTRFEAAIAIHRDPRYVFNLCLAEEALGSLDDAATTCRSILSMEPSQALTEKVKLRLDIIAEKKGS